MASAAPISDITFVKLTTGSKISPNTLNGDLLFVFSETSCLPLLTTLIILDHALVVSSPNNFSTNFDIASAIVSAEVTRFIFLLLILPFSSNCT